jgi:hypothetical protein
MTEKPRIFIASSSEQIDTAKRIAEALQDTARWTVEVWPELFDFSASYIESLEKELDRADFAIAVLTGDDAATVRKNVIVLPRDNVIFELGLFIGRLGRLRCFFFIDAESATQIASDLSGVKPVAFYPDVEATVPSKPGLATQSELVKAQMRELVDVGQGLRYRPNRAAREKQEALWRFSSRVASHWWERMRKGEDDMSALSYVTLSVDAVTNAPHLEGKVYALTGERLADWKSVTSGVTFGGEQAKIDYRWEGTHEGAEGQTYGGHGVITFDDVERLDAAEGYFFDTNFAHIDQGAPTRVKHFRVYRCTVEEVQIMQQPNSNAALALIKKRLNSLRG